MTLTEAVQLINKSKKLIIPLFLVIFSGAVGIHLLQRRQLPTEKLPSPADFGGSALPSSIRLKSGLKPPAKWGDVYQIVEGDFPLTKDWAEAVAKKFGFTASPKVAEVKSFIWSDSKKWLSLGESDLQYGLDLLNDPSLVGAKDKPLSSESEAAEAVRQFLFAKGFNAAATLTSLEASWVKVRGPWWVKADKEDEADALRLVMTEKIGESFVYEPGTEGLGTLAAYVGREEKIFKLSFSWEERDYKLFDRYPLRTLSEALAAGKVVEVRGEGLEEMIVELQSLYLTSASLGYVADSSTGFAYPVFVLQGEGRDREGKSFQTTVLAPAISSKWIE